MARERKFWLIVAISTLLTCVTAYSAWTEPSLLQELNSDVFAATRPDISSDGNLIYFVRHTDLGKFYLWEAQRNEETGVYENIRVVSEIGELGGRLIFGVWLSEDSHRMYHCWDDPDIPGTWEWGRSVSMAVRNNSNEFWQQIRHFPELQTDRALSHVSLTSDELNIMWTARNEVATTEVIYMASRESVENNFGNIKLMPKLNEIGAWDPYMTSDGLGVYFHLSIDDHFEIWKGSRTSLEEPFGNFEPLSEIINQPGSIAMYPCITPDKSKLYFYRYNFSLPESTAGIYVSHWVDTPREIAIKNIRKAIAATEAKIEKINLSIAPEVTAIESIEEMLETGELEGVARDDLVRTKIKLQRGIQDQVIERAKLQAKVVSLKTSLAVLLKQEIVDEGHGRGKIRRPIQFQKEIMRKSRASKPRRVIF